MSSSWQKIDNFRHPETFLYELIRKYAKGAFRERDEYARFLFRAIVLAVDVEGGKLENPNGSGKVIHEINGKNVSANANVGPINPKNSIKARIISSGFDQFFKDGDERVFWPFFPEHMCVPIKPKEHVYVLFEDEEYKHGLWITKVPGHEDLNYYKGENSFKKSNSSENNSLPLKFGDNKASKQQFNKDEDASESKEESRLPSKF